MNAVLILKDGISDHSTMVEVSEEAIAAINAALKYAPVVESRYDGSKYVKHTTDKHVQLVPTVALDFKEA